MFRRLVVAGGACLALAACSDSGPPPTGIQQHDVSTYTASGKVVDTGFGRSDTLQASSHGTLGKGLSLERAATSDGKEPVLPMLVVPEKAAYLKSAGGIFHDAQGRLHQFVVEPGGADRPPHAFRHYIDGRLMSITTMTWERHEDTWVQRDVRVKFFKGDSESVDVHATMGTVNTASASRRSPGLAMLAAGIAYMFAPRDVVAQTSNCTDAWQKYIMASGYVSGAIQALEFAIATGNPVAIAAATTNFMIATAAYCIAEYNLLACTGGTLDPPVTGGGKPIMMAPTRVVH